MAEDQVVNDIFGENEDDKQKDIFGEKIDANEEDNDLFADHKKEEKVDANLTTDEETDLFVDVNEPPKEVEEPPEDKLFEEEITEIPLDDNTKKEAPLAPAQLPDQNIDFDLESPTFGKTKEEIEEEESGDTFDINIKISDPMKIGDGMNAYMAYSVTTQTSIPTFKSSDFSVKRRFSDFLGLHERLNEKHCYFGIIVPPPPDKSVVGMVKIKGSKDDQASTDFVSKRKNALEKFLNRIARHKVLLEDPDFKEFLEAEELPRAKNTSALSKGGLSRLAKGIGEAVSKITSKMTETDSWFEEKQNRVEDLDRQIKKLHAATELLVSLRKEVSINTAAFAKSISLLSNSEEHTSLSRALSKLAELEEKVEHIQNEQASTDFYVLSETLKEYIGLIASAKAAFAQRVKVWTNWQSAKTTLTKKRELLVSKELSGKADKIGAAKDEVVEWERRVEKGEEEFEAISKSIKVEVARFEKMRVKDFKDLIISYLESLLGIEQQFVKLWEGFGPVAKSIC